MDLRKVLAKLIFYKDPTRLSKNLMRVYQDLKKSYVHDLQDPHRKLKKTCKMILQTDQDPGGLIMSSNFTVE